MSQALSVIAHNRPHRVRAVKLTKRQVRNLEGSVLAVWRGGADTVDIAARFSLTEADVYRITSARPPKPEPKYRIPFAGSEQ